MCLTAIVDPQRDIDEFANKARSWTQQYASEKPKVPIYKQPKQIQQLYEAWNSTQRLQIIRKLDPTFGMLRFVDSTQHAERFEWQPVVIQELYQISWRLGSLLLCAAAQPGCRLSLISQPLVLIIFNMSISHSIINRTCSYDLLCPHALVQPTSVGDWLCQLGVHNWWCAQI